MTDAPHPKLDELIAVLARLRAPGGCAWDREQTHESLVQYLLEEAYELAEAIETGSRDDVLEELGDVLYQVIFHSDIAAHSADLPFDIDDVAERMTAKMVGRHPHVFGETSAETAADVVALWEDVKAVEKPGRSSVLDGIPLAMPSLLLAGKLIGRAERVGVSPLPGPIHPSTSGAQTGEGAPAGAPTTEDELGTMLLSIVADARGAGLDAERALRTALRSLSADIRAAEQLDVR